MFTNGGTSNSRREDGSGEDRMTATSGDTLQSAARRIALFYDEATA